MAVISSVGASQAAGTGAGVVTYYGAGTSSCEKFTAVRSVNTHPSSDASIADINSAGEALQLQGVYSVWLQVYLTAFNQQAGAVPDILQGTDFDAALAWMGAYCQQNPTLEIAVAARAFAEFRQHQQRPGPAAAPAKHVATEGPSSAQIAKPTPAPVSNPDPWGSLGAFPLSSDSIALPTAQAPRQKPAAAASPRAPVPAGSTNR